MKEIILENFCNTDLPEEYKFIDISSFGKKDGNIWKMYDYQERALKNVMNALYFFYKDKESFYDKYRLAGLTEEMLDKVDFKKNEDSEAFRIMSNHYKVEDDKIPFKELMNRASFWMATGSGKTLVMIKLIEILFRLSKLDKANGGIDGNDILILAPKQQILDQIKEHIDIFNKSSDLFIELRSLKDWERTKKEQIDLYEESKVTVFYYTAHNLKAEGISTENELNYETFLHGTDESGYKFGKWYVLLDEAHKGVTGDSKRQSIYQILAKEGFLFNFSATFTDAIDKATTVANFNLERFINSGYGKHIKVTNQQFKNFNKRKDGEHSEEEKRKIVLKSLITLTAIKKAKEKIEEVKSGLYHNPLMITIANTIQTEEADLKIFFKELTAIASDNSDIADAKKDLLIEFNDEENKKFKFNSGAVSKQFYNLIAGITLKDIKKYVFNTDGSGTVEIIEIDGNQKELAFKMSTATSKPFALLVASDATKWMKDLVGYTVSTDIVSESYFKKLNDKDNTINILLGRNIFAEGWDSNRPNVVNFINIGVSEAQKFVLQAIGRGIRIEPIKGIRKRLDKAPATDKMKFLTVEENENIERYNQGIETVFVFSTNKEAVGAILKNIEQNETRDEWQLVEGIEKTEIANDLYVPEYEVLSVVNPNKFNITKNDFNRVQDYTNSLSEKLLIVDDGISVSTINKIKENSDDSSYFNFSGKTRAYSPKKVLLEIENHFNSKPSKLKQFRKIIDTDITHFQNVRTSLDNSEVAILKDKLISTIEQKYKSKEELYGDLEQKNITREQFELYLDQFKETQSSTNSYLPNIDRTFIKEHYYNPVLLASEINKDYFKNIIKEPSEVTFFKNLIDYYKTDNNLLKENYDWWYFSKLVENIDDVYIPYFNREVGAFRNFYPDFIFWLKKDDKYIIKFVDPKGITLAPHNTIDKVEGFKKVFFDEAIPIEDITVELFLYNVEGEAPNEILQPFSVTTIEQIFDD